jgi:hypothetical protein
MLLGVFQCRLTFSERNSINVRPKLKHAMLLGVFQCRLTFSERNSINVRPKLQFHLRGFRPHIRDEMMLVTKSKRSAANWGAFAGFRALPISAEY